MLHFSFHRIAGLTRGGGVPRMLSNHHHRYRLSSLAAASASYFPYGVSDWKKIKSKDSFYVDKTMYIQELERAGDYLKIWRPRRFGKSLFCQQLELYYDKNVGDEKVSALCTFTVVAGDADTSCFVNGIVQRAIQRHRHRRSAH